MPRLQIVKIKAQKQLYLVELLNSNGDRSEEWFDRAQLLFIDPIFFDKIEAGTSGTNIMAQPSPSQRNNETAPLHREPLQQVDLEPEPMQQGEQLQPNVEKNAPVMHDGFYCEYCGKKFGRKDHLRDHILKLHMGHKNQLRCPACPAEFGYKSNRTVHMLRYKSNRTVHMNA